MNSEIELYAFLDTMLWKEGLNLIEAENMENYNPKEEITGFLNVKANKFTKDNIIKQTCSIPISKEKPSSDQLVKKNIELPSQSDPIVFNIDLDPPPKSSPTTTNVGGGDDDECPGLIDIETGNPI